MPPAPASLARWPWPHVAATPLHRGIKRWQTAQPDGTLVELLEFDFKANPHLRWEIADQDADDKVPFDNSTPFQARSVSLMARGLNQRFARTGEGRVVAAWNGAFFGYDRKANPVTAFHVAPVVLRGKPYYTRINRRWTFGVRSGAGVRSGVGLPQWKVVYLPPVATLGQQFDWAASGVQCLILNGKPLKVQSYPIPGATPLPQPYPSSPREAGHIPVFDHMRTSRASLAWNRGSDTLWLLFVKEPDSENGSGLGLKRGADWPGATVTGGWLTSDVQRFWLACGAWCAINSDAGGVAQLLTARPDGRYDLIAGGAGIRRSVLGADLKTAVPSGFDSSIMYFYVRDAAR